MAEEKKTTRKKIQAADLMNKIMADYFYGLNEAATTGKRKVAWCTSVGPAELLQALGFAVHFPENHAAMLGATRMSTDLIPAANAIGYSPDICSYLTADIGAYLKGFTPLAKAYPGIESVPKPDVLVYNTNQCRDVQDWMAWYSKKLGVPSIGVTSPKNVNEVTDAHIDDVTRQIEALIPTLEGIAGVKLDMDRLRETVSLSRECTELWKQVLETAIASPAPITFFDGTIHMGPAVVLRGTREAIDYYKVLLAELEQRIRDGVGAVDGETSRIYWEGMPVWGRLRQHSELFANLKSTVLASTYCSSWIFPSFDGNDPIRSMAKAYLELFIVRSDRYKEKYIKEMLGEVPHRRDHLPRREDVPLQLEQPVRPARAGGGRNRRPLAGHLRRPQRPSLHLRRADENEHRGVHRTDRGGEIRCWTRCSSRKRSPSSAPPPRSCRSETSSSGTSRSTATRGRSTRSTRRLRRSAASRRTSRWTRSRERSISRTSSSPPSSFRRRSRIAERRGSRRSSSTPPGSARWARRARSSRRRFSPTRGSTASGCSARTARGSSTPIPR